MAIDVYPPDCSKTDNPTYKFPLNYDDLSRMISRMDSPHSPRCQVCRHDERWRIELLRAGGASFEALAAKFKIDRDALWRHWHKHVSQEMKAQYLCGPAQLAELAEKAASEGSSVLDYFRVVRTVLMAQLAAVSEAGDARAAAFVAGRLTEVLKAIGQVTGEISEIARSTINIQNNINVLNSPQFAELQIAILRALGPFPEARLSVVQALRDLDSEVPIPPIGDGAKMIEHHAE